MARGKRAVEHGRDEELHALRIAGKQLRYNLEFFESAIGPQAGTALGLLSHAQDVLGHVADADAFALLLRDLERDVPPGDARLPGIASLLAGCAAGRAHAVAEFHALWTGAGHSPYPDMLAAAVAAALESPPSSSGASGGAATTSTRSPNARENRSAL